MGHKAVNIPTPLTDEIDKLVDMGYLGYRSRAEFVTDCVRQAIRDAIDQYHEAQAATHEPRSGIA